MNSAIDRAQAPAVDPESTTTLNSSLGLRELYKFKHAIGYCISISLTGFLLGLDIGTIGGFLNLPYVQNKFGDANGSFSKSVMGLIMGLSSIFACLGGLLSNFLCDHSGRKNALISGVVFYLFGVLFLMASTNWSWIAFSRALCGLGIGVFSVAAPMLLSEIVQIRLRGSMVALMQLMTTLGIFVGSLILNYAHIRNGSKQFDIPCLSLIDSLWLVYVWYILHAVESPLFLVQMRLEKRAGDIVAKIYRLDQDHVFVKSWIENLKRSIETQEQQNSSKSLRQGQYKMLYRAILGICIMCFQQFTGINYFFFYGTSIFQAAGVDNLYLTAIILASVNLSTSIVSVFVSDRFNRRVMLIVGSCVMFCSMVVFSSVGSFALASKSAGVVMIIATCIFIGAFSMTWGPLAFMVVGELFPYNYKAKGMAYASSANWITTFLISFTTPKLSQLIGFSLGYVFAFFLLSSIFFVWVFIPETRRQEGDDIDALYEKGYRLFCRWPFSSKKTELKENSQDPIQIDLEIPTMPTIEHQEFV